MKWIFIVFCVYLASLFFREERLPVSWFEYLFDRYTPVNIVAQVDSVSVGFRRGLHVRGLRIYDTDRADPLTPLVRASSIGWYPHLRRIRIEDLSYVRLPDGYYKGGNSERNARAELGIPSLGRYAVTLVRPDILSIRAERIAFDVSVEPERIDFENIRLDWPDRDRAMGVDGFCYLDLERQEVYGEIDGQAWQRHIRPLLVTLDVPVALPYMDGFTEVPEPCPSWCAWKVDLIRKDFDLWLDLRPDLGRYNGVPMRHADGKIHLHNCIRDGYLNYVTTVGPIAGIDAAGRTLDGTVVIVGTNGNVTVDVNATSSLPLADVLRIGGFTGDYIGNDVVGDSACELQFRFPRAMSNNYEVLNGSGHVTVRNGQLMRMKGFQGLIEAMPSVAPAITWFTDTTQASCDYTIENGVVKTENGYVEGSLFSIKMAGWFDAVNNRQDFKVHVQFAKKDSMLGKVLHPLAWPFTKLLLEFRLTGTPENPKWTYITVVGRMLEAVK